MRAAPRSGRTRRRGADLESAIFEATIRALEEVGFTGLTMEGVAQRAGTGKAALYRRWPTRTDLVLAAVGHSLPERILPPDQGSLRADLLAVLAQVAHELGGPVGQALRGIITEVATGGEPHRADLSSGRSRALMRTIAERAAGRGDLPCADLSDVQLEVGVALLRQTFLATGHVPLRRVTAVVDDVVLPLWRCAAREAARRTGD